MLPGYNRIFNRFALAEVNRGVDVPDADLGVGFAEILAPVNLQWRYPSNQAQAIVQPVDTYEQTMLKGHSTPVSMDMFPATGYYGEPLGGF